MFHLINGMSTTVATISSFILIIIYFLSPPSWKQGHDRSQFGSLRILKSFIWHFILSNTTHTLFSR